MCGVQSTPARHATISNTYPSSGGDLHTRLRARRDSSGGLGMGGFERTLISWLRNSKENMSRRKAWWKDGRKNQRSSKAEQPWRAPTPAESAVRTCLSAAELQQRSPGGTRGPLRVLLACSKQTPEEVTARRFHLTYPGRATRQKQDKFKTTARHKTPNSDKD